MAVYGARVGCRNVEIVRDIGHWPESSKGHLDFPLHLEEGGKNHQMGAKDKAIDALFSHI